VPPFSKDGGGGEVVKHCRSHILVLCVLAAVLLTGAHNALQNALTDARFHWFPRPASGGIVLVAIDSPSIEGVGVWPWPRQVHAELLGKLESAGATDIVLDVDFSSPSNPASDQAFADALQKAGGSVVLPSFKQLVEKGGNEKTLHVNQPLAQLRKHAWPAVVNVDADPDGLVRRYPFGDALGGEFMPSVGALLAGRYESTDGPFRIDFSIRTDTVPTLSYLDILRGDPAAMNRLRDKKVIVGATAIELGDRFYVPNGRIVAGAMLQVLAAETILQGRVLRPSSGVVTLASLGLIALLMIALWGRWSAGLRVAVLVGLAAACELGATFLQARLAISLDTSLCHVAILAYLVTMALDEIDFRSLLGGIAERRFQRIAMSLGDGLACADRNGRITVWNPGAAAIFGYGREEMLGQPFDTICTRDGDAPFSILDLPHDALQVPGGKVMELGGCRKNGETFPLEACFSEWQGTDGIQYGAILRDISVRKREAEKIRYLAECDTLTGLANRNTLNAHLCAKLAEAKAQQHEVALLVMDLDKFKQVNDTLGHACGDQLLCAVAGRLNDLVGNAGLVARLSGDEFAVVISGARASDRAIELSERTCAAFDKTPQSVGPRQLRVSVSIGVAVYPKDCETAEELLGNADLALYRAKAAGRGRHVAFERRIRDELEVRLTLEAGLARGVEMNEFELFYQPQVNLADGRLVGAEALIRWRHPDRGIVLPVEFMPIANVSSISDSIALWVMENACRQGRLWQRNGCGIRLGVNLSPSQFLSGDLAATVRTVLKKTGFSPALLELEVTENILLADDESALEMFRRIQELGVHIAFDDFGTGYASMTYLKKYPLDRLKIDKSFVCELREASEDAAIVRSTIGLAKSLGLSVIAEGIEDRATVELLQSMGCEEGQGYYFGRPVPAAEFERRFLSKGVHQNADRAATVRVVSAA
jgi:diguanylate cyclase (GGDEF)-like protein/PAS domain S-box-containing protein